MIEYMNIPVLVCVSLLGVGAFVMIVGSLLKKQWATDGKKTSLSIYLLYLSQCQVPAGHGTIAYIKPSAVGRRQSIHFSHL